MVFNAWGVKPATPTPTFPIDVYLASCVRQVPPGTQAQPGHQVVSVQSETLDVDVAAAHTYASPFAAWLIKNVPPTAVRPFNAIDVGAALGDHDLAAKVTAVGYALGVWNIPTHPEPSVVRGARSRGVAAAARVVAVARGDRLPRGAAPARISAGLSGAA